MCNVSTADAVGLAHRVADIVLGGSSRNPCPGALHTQPSTAGRAEHQRRHKRDRGIRRKVLLRRAWRDVRSERRAKRARAPQAVRRTGHTAAGRRAHVSRRRPDPAFSDHWAVRASPSTTVARAASSSSEPRAELSKTLKQSAYSPHIAMTGSTAIARRIGTRQASTEIVSSSAAVAA